MKTITLNFIPHRKELKAAAPFSQTSFKANAPYNPKKANNAAAFSQAKSQLLATSPFIFMNKVWSGVSPSVPRTQPVKREIALFKQIMAMKNKFGEI